MVQANRKKVMTAINVWFLNGPLGYTVLYKRKIFKFTKWSRLVEDLKIRQDIGWRIAIQ
jgi:hypothetical protein